MLANSWFVQSRTRSGRLVVRACTEKMVRSEENINILWQQ